MYQNQRYLKKTIMVLFVFDECRLKQNGVDQKKNDTTEDKRNRAAKFLEVDFHSWLNLKLFKA